MGHFVSACTEQFFIFIDTTVITRFSDAICSPENQISATTYFLGCNPQVKITDANGQVNSRSVSLQCSTDGSNAQDTGGGGGDLRRRLATANLTAALGIVPSNGHEYAVQMLVLYFSL